MRVNFNGKIIITTLVSMLLCLAIIVSTSMSPIAATGLHSNKFNSSGMWLSVIIVSCAYLVPLIIYIVGFKPLKYVLAFIIGITVLSNLVIAVVTCTSSGMLLNKRLMIIILVECAAVIIDNFIWYKFAFHEK